jgi:hypothetical protein
MYTWKNQQSYVVVFLYSNYLKIIFIFDITDTYKCQCKETCDVTEINSTIKCGEYIWCCNKTEISWSLSFLDGSILFSSILIDEDTSFCSLSWISVLLQHHMYSPHFIVEFISVTSHVSLHWHLYCVMKRKFNQWWSTISSILTKRTITSSSNYWIQKDHDIWLLVLPRVHLITSYKSYSNKAMLLLGWSHCYTHFVLTARIVLFFILFHPLEQLLLNIKILRLPFCVSDIALWKESLISDGQQFLQY